MKTTIIPIVLAAVLLACGVAYGQTTQPGTYQYQPAPAGLMPAQQYTPPAQAAPAPSYQYPPAAPIRQEAPLPAQTMQSGTFGAPCPPIGVAAINCDQYTNAMKDLLALETKIQEEIIWTKKVRKAGFNLAAIAGPITTGILGPAAGTLGAMVNPAAFALLAPPVLLEIIGLFMVSSSPNVEYMRAEQTKILRDRFHMPSVSTNPETQMNEMRQLGLLGPGAPGEQGR